MMLKIKPSLEITPNAVKKIKEIMKQYPYKLYVRVYMQGNGCTGYKLNMALDRNKDTDDVTITVNDIDIVVDPITNQHMVGTKIDFDESDGSFIIDSPSINDLNANASCATCSLSCGPSGCN